MIRHRPGHRWLPFAVLVLIAAGSPVGTCAQETPPETAEAPQDSKPEPSREELFEAFSKSLSGSKFVGSFTVTGRDSGELTAEEYHIKSVQKMEVGDMWLFTARIKYNDRDISVPLPLEVKWAGDTPVITLTDLKFLGQGPFSARVVIYENKYAGTWSHGDHGGHLFGTIVPGAAEDVEVDDTEKRPPAENGDDKR
jgi:hypothetical protein